MQLLLPLSTLASPRELAAEDESKDSEDFFSYPYCVREFSQYLACLGRSIMMVFLISAFALLKVISPVSLQSLQPHAPAPDPV